MTKLLVRLTHKLYKSTLSLLFGNACRFYPSCSDYAREAIEGYGWIAGSWLALKRITRCHPWNEGGVDPVPPRRKE